MDEHLEGSRIMEDFGISPRTIHKCKCVGYFRKS